MPSSRRKPELEGLDAVLPAQPPDLMSSVIDSDRKRAGRGEYREAPAAESDIMTSPMTIGQTDQSQDTQADLPASGQPDSPAHADATTTPGPSVAAGTPDLPPASSHEQHPTIRGPGANEPPEPDERVPQRSRAAAPKNKSLDEQLIARRQSAASAAGSRTMTVTLRLPQAMNDWLDEYVHQSWPNRVKKQELVIEGLQMLIARRGRAGEPVLPTELLDEDKS
jgi:hypothetical protein